MKIKHTQGEWKTWIVRKQENISIYHDVKNDGTDFIWGRIADVYVGKDRKQAIADAKLIAATPDLLKTILILKERLELEQLGYNEPLMVHSAIINAERVIKKATE